jgi:hypothetical protein
MSAYYLLISLVMVNKCRIIPLDGINSNIYSSTLSFFTVPLSFRTECFPVHLPVNSIPNICLSQIKAFLQHTTYFNSIFDGIYTACCPPSLDGHLDLSKVTRCCNKKCPKTEK